MRRQGVTIIAPADVVRLDRGDLDIRPPTEIAAAAAVAARAGWPSASAYGAPELRHRLARRLFLRTGQVLAPEQLLVTAGASQGLSLIFSTLLQAGDEVLVPDPGWPRYQAIARRRGITPIGYPIGGDAAAGPRVDDIAGLVGPKTRAIVINSPGNPTGDVLAAEVVEGLVALSERRKVLIISDEAYDEMVYDGEVVSPAAFGGRHTITVHSFSKTYAMADWRVGYLVGESRVVRRLAVAQETDLLRVSPIVQAAAMAALSGPQAFPDRLRATMRRRRDSAVEALTAVGLDVRAPAAGFFLIVPLAAGVDPRAACRDLLGYGVALAPGTAFGTRLPHHLRLSLTAPDDELGVGVQRLAEWSVLTGAGLGRPAAVGAALAARR